MSPRKQNIYIAYLFMAPALVLLGLFTFIPVGFNTYLAFHDYRIADGSSVFTGLANFRYILQEELFHDALKNSLLYLLTVPVVQIVALVCAKLVNNKLAGMTLVRATLYVPVITAISIAGVVWTFVYKYDGMLNGFLGWVGRMVYLLAPGETVEIDWLGDPDIALWAVMAFTCWKGIGYYMVLYLAGLQAIPREVEEAARLDGATAWDAFWRITVPMVKPTILLCTLLSTIGALKAFQEVLVLTRGQSDTYTALYYVYDQAFKNFVFGRSAAAGLVVTFFCVLLAVIQFRMFKAAK
ncbi:carbohydrate ABC transporter permease [Chitinibacteraceae bacterium HSL-7]